VNNSYKFITEAQFKSEIRKCEYCEEKPCREACPANCSPADFIMAAKVGNAWDFKRAAAEILRNNPLGGVCGVVCPDYHCMQACVHEKFDTPVEIPQLQASIVAKAKAIGLNLNFVRNQFIDKKIAIVGAGPAGLSAAAVLAQMGYKIDIFEKEDKPGGACNLIPEFRLPEDVLKSDVQFIQSLQNIEIKFNTEIQKPVELVNNEYEAVLVAVGLWQSFELGLTNDNLTISGIDFLMNPDKYTFRDKVAIIGGGATACDCALTLKHNKVKNVELFALESINEMPLTNNEKDKLFNSGVDINGRIKLAAFHVSDQKITGIQTKKVTLPDGKKFNIKDISDIPGSEQNRDDIKNIIVAIGATSKFQHVNHKAIFYAGDFDNGPTSVVEAVASGKNAAQEIDAYLSQREKPVIKNNVKSFAMVPGYKMVPVSLETEFFGRKIVSPFILSASPSTDGFEQMKLAYDAGWAGGIMKTAFDNIPIHIPGEYMHAFTQNTYGNCDNVSGHALDRVCKEIEQLIRLFPNRLTMGSTGGAVTGDEKMDRKSWQSNTKKLENAGAMGIEYSLSCPQGGDGTEGDIVSQNAKLTATIIDWVMEVSNPQVPKLFKLTGAVTSIVPIVNAIKEVFNRYPNKKAGITLANSFPTMIFRQGEKKWEEGVVVGMSGAGILPLSYLSLASVGHIGIAVSGNGGPMDYKATADFLALGAKTVQFCTIVMKYGYQIYDEICSGVSHLLEARGIKSINELIGFALPNPITDFMDLSATKKISDREKELCLFCGNCTRCPYLAVSLDEEKYPVTDASKCIGCSICAQKCFSGALFMRERTEKETAILSEA
jgi:dihydropyrimidine dehydrogenase (NAD+) subunit PreT